MSNDWTVSIPKPTAATFRWIGKLLLIASYVLLWGIVLTGGTAPKVNWCNSPQPEPTPTPPEPKPPEPPPPSPAPIPVDGFRVLFVIESNDALTAQQRLILTAKSVRDYLNAKCVVGPDGKTREWRQWDYDIDTSAESKLWQDAMKLKPSKDKLPWIIISNHPKGGYAGPLPATINDTLDLLKKHSGE